jgi:hypothetical protein
MHPHEALVRKLLESLSAHCPASMAECYHKDATFRDITFDLLGRDEIHAMWAMIATGDLQSKFKIRFATDREVVADVVDIYHFDCRDNPPGRFVTTCIESRFKFHEGLIVQHIDECDPIAWGRMAIGGVKGELAGRIRFVRALLARKKLDQFIRENTVTGTNSSSTVIDFRTWMDPVSEKNWSKPGQ